MTFNYYDYNYIVRELSTRRSLNLLNNANNQQSKFRTKNWVEVDNNVIRE